MMTIAVGRPLIDLLSLSYRANRSVLLFGRHGVGKSVATEQAASELGIGCITIDLALCEPVDLVGLPQIRDERTRFAPPAMLPSSGSGLLVLEELNRAPRHVRSPCLQLLSARRLNEYQLPPGWLPVACANPPSGTGDQPDAALYHVDELDPALVSRFSCVEVHPAVAEWLPWAKRSGVHSAVVQLVQSSKGRALVDPEANPRAWEYASDVLKAHDEQPSSDEVLQALLVGYLGERWGNALWARAHGGSDKPLAPDAVIARFELLKPVVTRWRQKKKVELLKATWEGLRDHLMTNQVACEVARSETLRANVMNFVARLPTDVRGGAERWVTDHLAAFEGAGLG
jgi:hypothetical protein